MTAALSADSVWHRYRRRGTWALRDVSLSVPTGSITAFVGPNGAGKSTLIRSWLGMERPQRGRVAVLGVDPVVDRAAAIERLGHVSQSLGLYGTLSVRDHIRLAGTLRPGFDALGATARLDSLRIPLDRRPPELSGGQQAHVALALALSSGAPVLLLDEPLAALDPLARHDLIRILAEDVRARGATALISSHILADIETACDRLLMIRSGALLIDAPIRSVIDDHRVARVGTGRGQPLARFHRPGGELVELHRHREAGDRPTLEELVMGYLAAPEPDGYRA